MNDQKQLALRALAMAAQSFFIAAVSEHWKQNNPGRAQAAGVLIADGRAHLSISIQMSATEIRGELALVDPLFADIHNTRELSLSGPIAAAFADPAKLAIVDLGKVN